MSLRKNHVAHHLLIFTLLLSVIIGISVKAIGANQPASVNTKEMGSDEGSETLLTVPFITVREKTGSDKVSEYFSGERGSFHAGYCDITSTWLDRLKLLTDKLPYFPEEIVNLSAIREVPVEALLQDLNNTRQQRRPVVYLHGFYIDFARGCRRASLFQRSADLNGRFLFFSWPSDGAITNYTRDESDLYWSVEPLRQKLSRLVNQFGAGNIDIAAHSLGTRGVMLAMVMMAQANKDNKPVFNQVVLMAPDIDEGIFRQYLPMIKPLANNITVYVSDNDQPLAIARQVHGHPRLGESGEHLDGLDGVEIIDVTDMSVRAPSGHVYHLYNEMVIEDVAQLLNDNKRAAERINLKQTGNNYWRLQPPAQVTQ